MKKTAGIMHLLGALWDGERHTVCWVASWQYEAVLGHQALVCVAFLACREAGHNTECKWSRESLRTTPGMVAGPPFLVCPVAQTYPMRNLQHLNAETA